MGGEPINLAFLGVAFFQKPQRMGRAFSDENVGNGLGTCWECFGMLGTLGGELSTLAFYDVLTSPPPINVKLVVQIFKQHFSVHLVKRDSNTQPPQSPNSWSLCPSIALDASP